MEKSEERKSGVRTARAGSFAEVCVGRLVEVHVIRLGSLLDVESLNSAVLDAVRRVGPQAVVFADCRMATPLAGEVANAWSQAMRQTNGAIARSAMLLDPSNTMFNLQVERIVQCAGNDKRRLFKDPDELRDWLNATLTETERAALGRLLLGGQAGDLPPSLRRVKG